MPNPVALPVNFVHQKAGLCGAACAQMILNAFANVSLTSDEQEMLWEADPDTYSKPAYLWPGGWVAVALAEADWDLVEARLRTSWTLAAPKRLAGALA